MGRRAGSMQYESVRPCVEQAPPDARVTWDRGQHLQHSPPHGEEGGPGARCMVIGGCSEYSNRRWRPLRRSTQLKPQPIHSGLSALWAVLGGATAV